ncbi:hypothetical protein LshimejAT787_0211580 [Lyophyllum shimeji]|uniref:RING-type domain-containing protein n=1 Tax=Lyophyllum shimeji TaxID=47721 RepID=A0A9P3PGN2_LYOSH|nr:hypothetical protein LshimejAT787_0211580 [Lyophyllum shimeji]
MPDPRIQCNICHESFTIDRFRFLVACGHGYCQECLRQIPRRHGTIVCPACRSEDRWEPRQIYVTFEEPMVPTLSVAEGVEKLVAYSPAASIGHALWMVKQEAYAVGSSYLLDAAQRVERHLAFASAALERNRLEVLEACKAMKSRLDEAESMRSEVVGLRTRLRDTNAKLETADTLLEDATARAEIERNKRFRLDMEVKKLEEALNKQAEKASPMRILRILWVSLFAHGCDIYISRECGAKFWELAIPLTPIRGVTLA